LTTFWTNHRLPRSCSKTRLHPPWRPYISEPRIPRLALRQWSAINPKPRSKTHIRFAATTRTASKRDRVCAPTSRRYFLKISGGPLTRLVRR
jgi:hypothetical protein